jgi:hypothetical protein
MRQVADISAIVVAAIALSTALAGAWVWWRSTGSGLFWGMWRATQAATTALAAVALVAAITGLDPESGLFWLYMLLPIAISIIAEQLRIATAQYVLDKRGLEDAQAVGRLEPVKQREIVLQIAGRELATAALACAVIAFLALRVLGTA